MDSKGPEGGGGSRGGGGMGGDGMSGVPAVEGAAVGSKRLITIELSSALQYCGASGDGGGEGG